MGRNTFGGVVLLGIGGFMRPGTARAHLGLLGAVGVHTQSGEAGELIPHVGHSVSLGRCDQRPESSLLLAAVHGVEGVTQYF